MAALDDSDRKLCEMALRASNSAYAPYSGFAVGAAVRTRSGAVYAGANLENASYGMTMCAEVSAITAANAAGDYDIEAIAVAGFKFTPPACHASVCTPCGRCRQLIFEASQVVQRDVKVLSCNGDLSEIDVTTISKLLPKAFGPENLGVNGVWPGMRVLLQKAVATVAKSSTDASSSSDDLKAAE